MDGNIQSLSANDLLRFVCFGSEEEQLHAEQGRTVPLASFLTPFAFLALTAYTIVFAY